MNKKVLTLAAVALTFSVGADAQLNLKGLVKNATKKVKDKVEKTTKEAISAETSGKTLDISSAVSGDYDPSNNYTPSKEAKAADAFASATQKFDGLTKNMSQLCGAYEHLPKTAFPYQPYYQYNQLYYFDRQECDKFCNSVSAAMLKALMGSGASAVNDNLWSEVSTMPNGQKGYLPQREIMSNMLYAMFAADPYCDRTFRRLVMVLVLDRDNSYRGTYNLMMDDEANNVVNSAKGWMSPYPASTIKNWWFERQEFCLNIARNQTPWKVVRDYLLYMAEYAVKADQGGDPMTVAGCKMNFDVVWKDIAEQHKDFKSDNELLAAKSKMDKYVVYQLAESHAAANAKPVNMPAAVTMDAATTKALNDAAREAFGANVVKAYFTSKDWHVFKNPNYPYEIRHRSVNAVIIVNEGGKNYMYTRIFAQNHNGKAYTQNYSLQAPMPDPGKQLVNMK